MDTKVVKAIYTACDPTTFSSMMQGRKMGPENPLPVP